MIRFLIVNCVIILSGLQAFEIMAIAAVGNNLITYVINEMHFSLSNSANIVTNFIGTVFLLALLGGYLSDSFLGSFWTMLIFGFVELSVSFFLFQIQPFHFPLSLSLLYISSAYRMYVQVQLAIGIKARECFYIYNMIPCMYVQIADLRIHQSYYIICI